MSAQSTSTNYNNPRFEAHMRFVCPECGKDYNSPKIWRQHLNAKHDYLNKSHEDFSFKRIKNQNYECQVCNTRVEGSFALLQSHRFLHLPFNRTYRCRYCSFASTGKRELFEHFLRDHKEYVGEVEQDVADPQSNPEFYLRFRCPQCGRFIERYREWLLHIEKAHETTSSNFSLYRCIIDDKNENRMHCTNDKRKLQRNRFQYFPHKEYFQCAFCTAKKSYKTEILHHFICVHKSEFANAKPYIRIPNEWGDPPSKTLIRELQTMLQEKEPNSKERKGPAVIQKALQASFINLEELSGTVIEKQTNVRAEPNPNCVVVKEEKQKLDDLHNEAFDLKPQPLPKRKRKPPTATMTLDQIQSSQCESKQNESISVEKDREEFNPKKKRFTVDKETKKVEIESLKLKVQKEEQAISERTPFDSYIHYVCPECGAEFADKMQWSSHVHGEHGLPNMVKNSFEIMKGNAVLCKSCLDVLPTQKYSKLLRHCFTHIKYKSYLKCKMCGECMTRKPYLMAHIEKCHQEVLNHKPKSSQIEAPLVDTELTVNS